MNTFSFQPNGILYVICALWYYQRIYAVLNNRKTENRTEERRKYRTIYSKLNQPNYFRGKINREK